MPVIDWDIDHGSAEWYRRRAGIPTASNFHLILTPKKRIMSEARWPYAVRLICERILNWQADSLATIQHIADGIANEPKAIAQLEFSRSITTRPVGLIRTDDGRFGATPDRLVMAGDTIDMTVETKAPSIPTQMARLLFGDDVPIRGKSHADDYICQRQGQLFVADADKAIFYSWHERMPEYMVENGRDEAFIHQLSDALEQFSDELEKLHELALTKGAYQAFAEMIPPLDAERGAAAGEEIVDSVMRGEF